MRFTRYSLMPILVAVAVPLGRTTAVCSQEDAPATETFVLTAKEAILLDAPVVVASGGVEKATWAPTGQFVMAMREKARLPDALLGRPLLERSLILWSAKSGQSRTLWNSKSSEESLSKCDWLAGTHVALGLMTRLDPVVPGKPVVSGTPAETSTWLVRLDARAGTMRSLCPVPEMAQLLFSPATAVAVVYGASPLLLQGVTPAGTLRDYTRIIAGLAPRQLAWSPDGKQLVFSSHPPTQPGTAKSSPGWYALDVTTGKISGPGPRPEAASRSPKVEASLMLRSGQNTLRERDQRRNIRPLWLESSEQGPFHLALVSPDASQGVLSPRNDAVLYLSGEAAWVRPLVRMDREAYLAAYTKARQTTLMSNLRQVATGILVYAAQNGETLPASGADLETLLLPILGDRSLARSILSGFQYTFPGGKLTDVDRPSETELGQVAAPGGRVVVFVDGHVKYIAE